MIFNMNLSFSPCFCVIFDDLWIPNCLFLLFFAVFFVRIVSDRIR